MDFSTRQARVDFTKILPGKQLKIHCKLCQIRFDYGIQKCIKVLSSLGISQAKPVLFFTLLQNLASFYNRQTLLVEI